ncbi:hypothetical protein B0H10DRAFT_1990781 [Mycena sp. CBHHK59/15]|nr:hypothetical protein B0H10DRAFT_1990781 [Mycena sp. CBHHK59/15]
MRGAERRGLDSHVASRPSRAGNPRTARTSRIGRAPRAPPTRAPSSPVQGGAHRTRPQAAERGNSSGALSLRLSESTPCASSADSAPRATPTSARAGPTRAPPYSLPSSARGRFVVLRTRPARAHANGASGVVLRAPETTACRARGRLPPVVQFDPTCDPRRLARLGAGKCEASSCALRRRLVRLRRVGADREGGPYRG